MRYVILAVVLCDALLGLHWDWTKLRLGISASPTAYLGAVLAEQGLSVGNSQRHGDALWLYTAAAWIDPSSARAFMNRAVAAEWLSDFQTPRLAYEIALALNPNYVQAYANRTGYRVETGDLKGAREDADRVRALDAQVAYEHAKHWFRFAQQRGNDNAHESAITDLNKAILLVPDNTWYYWERGWNYAMLHRKQEALADYDKALQLAPEDPLSYTQRGIGYFYLGDYQNAVDEENMALTMDRCDLSAYYFRGRARYELGQTRAALADFNEAISGSPQFTIAYKWRGAAKRQLGDLTGAKADELEYAKQSANWKTKP